MYIIKLKRDLPPFTRGGCTVEEIYFLGVTHEDLIDAIIKFGGLLTTNPNAQREESSKVIDTKLTTHVLPAEVTRAVDEMAVENRRLWVVTVRTLPNSRAE